MVEFDKDNVCLEVDRSKCMKCEECQRVCTNEVTVGRMRELANIKKPLCINCGQCANICPTEAIKEKIEYKKVKEEIKNPDKTVIVSIAPAVRVALGEEFGLEAGSYVEDKIIGALRKLGAKYVLDITFGADLTIMEEASELIERIKENKNLPLFTSCCPAWVRYAEIFYPELLPNLSSCKSPISMQGALIKTYFAKKMNLDPKNIVNVVVAPCTAKKYEVKREEMNDAGKEIGDESIRDNDYVITTRELATWIKEENIDFSEIPVSEFDNPLGRGTGAGIIFGSTGGVMEAALRTAYYFITGEDLKQNEIEFNAVRGMTGIKEAEVKINDITVKVAVANGMKYAQELIKKILNKEVEYHFVEIMNCEGGCIAGGGQPKLTMVEMQNNKVKRMNGLYSKDTKVEKRLSYKNNDIIDIYNEMLDKPLSEISEKFLHTEYKDRSYLLKEE